MDSSIFQIASHILKHTNDGDDLAPEHLKLLEMAVNGFLNEAGEQAFQELYQNVQEGYVRPYFHGIEHLTIDHEGFVYWKGNQVEHYNIPWAYGEEAQAEARELAQRCILLERTGKSIDSSTTVWRWDEMGR